MEQAALAASLLGSSMIIFLETKGSSSKDKGTRVVLPTPGAASRSRLETDKPSATLSRWLKIGRVLSFSGHFIHSFSLCDRENSQPQ